MQSNKSRTNTCMNLEHQTRGIRFGKMSPTDAQILCVRSKENKQEQKNAQATPLQRGKEANKEKQERRAATSVSCTLTTIPRSRFPAEPAGKQPMIDTFQHVLNSQCGLRNHDGGGSCDVGVVVLERCFCWTYGRPLVVVSNRTRIVETSPKLFMLRHDVLEVISADCNHLRAQWESN